MKKIYLAWDDDPELFQVTVDNQIYQNSRLATLKEVQQYGGDSDNFISSIKSDELVEVVEGVLKTVWETEKDPYGFKESYLYFVDFEDKKTLIY